MTRRRMIALGLLTLLVVAGGVVIMTEGARLLLAARVLLWYGPDNAARAWETYTRPGMLRHTLAVGPDHRIAGWPRVRWLLWKDRLATLREPAWRRKEMAWALGLGGGFIVLALLRAAWGLLKAGWFLRCTRRRRIDPFAPIWLDPSFSSSSFLACALISGRCRSRPLPSGLMGVKLHWRLLGQISLALTAARGRTTDAGHDGRERPLDNERPRRGAPTGHAGGCCAGSACSPTSRPAWLAVSDGARSPSRPSARA